MLRVVRAVGAKLFSFPATLTALLITFVSILCVGLHLFSDPDIWWHLRDAEYLLRSHHFIQADSYSFSVTGRPWIDSEWLSELAFYAAWKGFGPRGIWILTIGLIEAVILGVCWLGSQQTRTIKPALLACLPFILLLSVSMGPRTILVGWLCLIAEIYLLREFKSARDHLWLLPLLFVFWINAHGTWPIGVVYLLLYLACGIFQHTWGNIVAQRWTPAERKKLFWVSGLCALALFINPYGLQLILFPAKMLFGHKLMIESVQEWQSLDFHSVRGKLTFGIIAVLLICNAVRRRNWQLNEVVFTLIAILAGFTYTRMLVLAGIALCPALALECDFFSDYVKEHDRPALNFAMIFLAAGILITQIPKQSTLREQIDVTCPERAMAYLAAAKPPGRTFNDLSWGGYLEMNSRDTPVFIDSRSELFDPWGVLQDYLDVMAIKKPSEILDRWRIRYVVLPKDAPIIYLLLRTPAWKVLYQDEVAIVMEHDEAR